MRVVNTPLCPFCEKEEESAYHFLGQCEHFAVLRLRIFGKDQLTHGELWEAGVRDVLRLIKAAGRFDWL